MPARSARPGFKRGRHNLPYWIATQVVRDAMGYPDKCIALPPDADDETINQLCQSYTEALFAFIEEQKKIAAEGGAPGLPPYDGTVHSACEIYQRHPLSPFKSVKANTRKTYTDSLKVIQSTVGKRVVRNLTTFDCQHWYEQWRKPVVVTDADGNEVVGPERVDRAHNAIAMFRTVVRFCAKLKPKHRFADCAAIAADLEKERFEKGGSREQEMTLVYARAFIDKALELGRKDVVPWKRALSMAIGVAAQFELLLRQKDIIGERPKTADDLEKARRRGATVVPCGGKTWVGYFTWENIGGWRWLMKTSKSKYRATADFDLTIYGLLMPLLEMVPHNERAGAIVKGEHDWPVEERSYRKWFRQIARAANIPDEVWNMDTRAGGATEADEAGAPIRDISQSMTHADERITGIYIRRRARSIRRVAEVRQANRKANETGES
jgi:hypothetical protein